MSLWIESYLGFFGWHFRLFTPSPRPAGALLRAFRLHPGHGGFEKIEVERIHKERPRSLLLDNDAPKIWLTVVLKTADRQLIHR